VEAYLARAPEGGPPFRLVDVISRRPVSNAIAEALGVPHESPQLILIKGGAAVASQSHSGITAGSIEEALQGR